MAAPVYKTKGELRAELLIALGYGGLGSAAGAFVPRADYLLEQAQENLYLLMPDEKRKRTWELITGINQSYYDIPADCDIERISMVAAYFEQTWLPMKRGIDVYHDSTASYINYFPQRYDIESVIKPVPELQVNGDMSIDISAAFGDAARGWTWSLSGAANVSTGKLRNTAAINTITATAPVIIGTTYDISYEIESAGTASTTFGGKGVDDDGNPIGVSVGIHTHRVTASTTASLEFIAGTTLQIDNVSIKEVLSVPTKTQIELWPTDDSTQYQWKIEGLIQLMPFVADGDRATIDDRLILLYAEAYGKAHLNKPDASFVMAALKERLKLLRGNQHGQQRYKRGDQTPDPLPRPIVLPQITAP